MSVRVESLVCGFYYNHGKTYFIHPFPCLLLKNVLMDLRPTLYSVNEGSYFTIQRGQYSWDVLYNATIENNLQTRN